VRGNLLAALGLSVSICISSVASAQSDGAPVTEEVDGREAFRRGSEAAAEERWADSERWFRRAYELSGVSSALFNQAVALRALGRHREARDAFRTLLAGDVEGAVRDTATQLMAQSVARVATIAIEGLEAGEEHAVQLDGETRPDDLSRPLEIEADEGAHSVLVVRSGYQPLTRSVTVEAGGRATLRLELERIPEQTVVVRETVREGVSVFEEPVFWIIVGVVLAGAGAAIGIYVGFEDAQIVPNSMVRFDL